MIETAQTFIQDQIPNPYLRAVAILIASAVLAKLADLIISGILRVATSRTNTDLDDKIIERLHGPLFKSFFLLGGYIAVLELEPTDRAKYWIIGLLGTFLLFLWARAIYDICALFFKKLGRSERVHWIDSQSEPLFENVNFILIWALAAYVLLKIWDLDPKPWLASAGVAGIAIGFAAKDSLANVIGGFFVLIDKPYKIGDYVNLDSGERGKVTRIGLRSTRLLTRDDIEVTIPNAIVGNAKIVNESSGPYEKARVTINVGVAYGSDIDQVRRVLLEASEDCEYIERDPEPRVRFTAFGNSSLDFRLLCWVAVPEQRGLAIDELHCAIYKRFKQESIEIPFPQRDLHLRSGSLS